MFLKIKSGQNGQKSIGGKHGKKNFGSQFAVDVFDRLGRRFASEPWGENLQGLEGLSV